MKMPKISRRDLLKGAGVVVAGQHVLDPRAGERAAAGAGHARP